MKFNERFPSYGKELHNELINLPYNEQRRINEILTQKTKRKEHKECLVPGGNCEGKVVEGHSVPKSVMQKMTTDVRVISFVRQPLGSKGYVLPSAEPINHALTGYFTCEKHEGLFAPVEKEIPDFDNPNHLDLMAYKALLRAMWTKGLMRAAYESRAGADPKSDLPTYMVHLHTDMERGVGRDKYAAEQTLGIAIPNPEYDAGLGKLMHSVIRVPSGRRTVAVSAWSNGIRTRSTLFEGGLIVENIPQYGCTVYPLENEHVIVYHYTASDESGVRRSNWHLHNATGKVLQRRISQDILGHCEDIVIAPEVWQDFSAEKRQAIEDYFKATVPNIGLYSPDAPVIPSVASWHSKRLRLVNLFD